MTAPAVERDPLEMQVRERPLPAHVGIIMDGNGRWAEERGLPRLEGHREGSKSVREVTRTARRIGVQALTLYAFSAQNWSRPVDEVAGLMDLLREYLESERQEILENGIRLEAVGELDRLPRFVRAPLEAVREESARNRGMVLTLALSYGGQEEIAAAADALVRMTRSTAGSRPVQSAEAKVSTSTGPGGSVPARALRTSASAAAAISSCPP